MAISALSGRNGMLRLDPTMYRGNTENISAHAAWATAELGQVVRGQHFASNESRYVTSDANLNTFSVKFGNDALARITGMELIGQDARIHYEIEGKVQSATISGELAQQISQRNEMLDKLEKTFDSAAASGVINPEEQKELQGLIGSINEMQAQVMRGIDSSLGLSERLAMPKETAAPVPPPKTTESEGPSTPPEFAAPVPPPKTTEAEEPKLTSLPVNAGIPRPSAAGTPPAAPSPEAPPSKPIDPPAATITPVPPRVTGPPIPAPAPSTSPPSSTAPAKPGEPPRPTAMPVSPGISRPSSSDTALVASSPAKPVSASSQVAMDLAAWLVREERLDASSEAKMFTKLESLSPADRRATFQELGPKFESIFAEMLSEGASQGHFHQKMGDLLATMARDTKSDPRMGEFIGRALRVVDENAGSLGDHTIRDFVNNSGVDATTLKALPGSALELMSKVLHDGSYDSSDMDANRMVKEALLLKAGRSPGAAKVESTFQFLLEQTDSGAADAPAMFQAIRGLDPAQQRDLAVALNDRGKLEAVTGQLLNEGATGAEVRQSMGPLLADLARTAASRLDPVLNSAVLQMLQTVQEKGTVDFLGNPVAHGDVDTVHSFFSALGDDAQTVLRGLPLSLRQELGRMLLSRNSEGDQDLLYRLNQARRPGEPLI